MSKKKFTGILTDEELFYIEDGLNLSIKDFDKVLTSSQKEKAKNIITKLYTAFWETPKGKTEPDPLVANYR